MNTQLQIITGLHGERLELCSIKTHRRVDFAAIEVSVALSLYGHFTLLCIVNVLYSLGLFVEY